jgi:FKBP-type peptidyl-prolyl cis-trans isomerase SlyD
MIKNGSVVSFEYKVSDENGVFLESSKGEPPVTYTHGQHEIVPGLEKGLSGMELNEEKSIRVGPEEGYGPVDPQGFKEVPKAEIPAEVLRTGATLNARGPGGEEFSVRVHEIKDETVVLDLNHPLAGKTLTFDVRVVDIKDQP